MNYTRLQSGLKIQKATKYQNTPGGTFVTISTADAATTTDHNIN